MERIIQSYCENDAKKLNEVVDKVINQRFGGTYNKNMSDFYFIAQEVMSEFWLYNTYNPSQGDFESFLYNSLLKAFIDDNKSNNRDKRKSKIIVEVEDNGKIKKKKVSVSDICLDAPIGDNENSTYGDLIAGSNDIESQILNKEDKEDWHIETKKYLESLSPLQREIALMISDNYTPDEICADLHITMQHYINSVKRIFADEKIKILRPLVERKGVKK